MRVDFLKKWKGGGVVKHLFVDKNFTVEQMRAYEDNVLCRQSRLNFPCSQYMISSIPR